MVEIVSTTDVIVNGSTAVSGLRMLDRVRRQPAGSDDLVGAADGNVLLLDDDRRRHVVDGHELVVGRRTGLSEGILDGGGDDIVDLIAGIAVDVRDRELAAVGSVGVDHLTDEVGAVIGHDRGTGRARLVADHGGIEVERREQPRRRRSGS